MIDIVKIKHDTDIRYVAIDLDDREPHLVAILDKQFLNVLFCLNKAEAEAVIGMFLNQWTFNTVQLEGCVEDILPYLKDYKNIKVKGVITQCIDEVSDTSNRLVCDGIATVLKMLNSYPDTKQGMVITISKKDA